MVEYFKALGRQFSDSALRRELITTDYQKTRDYKEQLTNRLIDDLD